MHRKTEEQTSPTDIDPQRPHSRRLDGLFDEVPQGRRMVLELN